MALEDVIGEIISQAEKQKREIIEQGKQESWKILDEAANKAKQWEKSFQEETKKILDENRRMEISALNIQLHKTFLETKRSILDELYSKLAERIGTMDAAKRKEILQRLTEKAKKELPNAKFVYCINKDKEIISKITNLQFRGTVDCLGGIIAANAAEDVRINYTFDVLLQQVRELHLNEIAERIF